MTEGRTVREILGKEHITDMLDQIDKMPWPDKEKKERREALQMIEWYYPFDAELAPEVMEDINKLGIFASGTLGPLAPFALPQTFYDFLLIVLTTAYGKGFSDGQE